MVFGRKEKNPAPSSQALSSDAEALARISANVACVIHSESPNGRDLSVPELVSRLVASHRELEILYQNLRRERDVFEHGKTTLERTIQASQERAQAQKEEWKNREDLYCGEINRLKDTVQHLRQSCEENNREILKQRAHLNKVLEASHDAQEQLQQSHERKVDEIQRQNAKSEAGLKAKYESRERRMKEEYDSAMHDSEAVVRSLKKNAEIRAENFESEKMQLKESHRIEQERIRETFNAQEFQLKQAHKQQQERLQRDIQSRNRALIARENYSPITDGELKSMFSGLVREVDSLARLRWTMNQSPWPDEELSRISDTPKRLQKQIMKETIWDVLYEQVFCSPFRVFGTEGGVLESEWNKAFRKGKLTLA